MKKAHCIEHRDGSFSIRIDRDLALSIGFCDQMIAEASFNENGDLVVTPYRDPIEEKEMKNLIEEMAKKYRPLLDQIKNTLGD